MACEAVFLQKLRERGLRLTPQREMALAALHETPDFATAEEIYRRVRLHSASVDISTIYRTLELFQEFDLVACVDASDGQRRYKLLGIELPHLHLVCRVCGSISGVDLAQAQPLVTLLQSQYGFTAEIEHLSIPGVCQRCQA